jgi:hypothetical protein
MFIVVETRIEVRYRGWIFELPAFKPLVSIQASSPFTCFKEIFSDIVVEACIDARL